MEVNPQAKALNETIETENKVVYSLLSERGKRIFFPKLGIVGQSMEAKKHANPNTNATIGIASNKNGPLVLPSLAQYFNQLTPAESFDYTSSMGNATLRSEWKKRMVAMNPLLKNKPFSNPVVCSGLTHSIDTVSNLFLNPGDTVVLPDQIWGNYRLILSVKNEVKLKYFPFFDGNSLNVSGLQKTIESIDGNQRIAVILNFPNNPTGYSPTNKDAQELLRVLTQCAEKRKLLVILDEAYYGLFFGDDVYQHSLFSSLADAHKNLAVVKVCGATKELFCWGFRVGFISFAIKGGTEKLYSALEQKIGGLVRASVSNCSTPAQNILVKILQSDDYKKELAKNFTELKDRIDEVKRVLSNSQYGNYFDPLPFNSGYFMLIRLKNAMPAEEIRKALLTEEKAGVICTAPHDLRIAFSCLEKQEIAPFFEKIAKVCKKFA